jgi:hypothetical protein
MLRASGLLLSFASGRHIEFAEDDDWSLCADDLPETRHNVADKAGEFRVAVIDRRSRNGPQGPIPDAGRTRDPKKVVSGMEDYRCFLVWSVSPRWSLPQESHHGRRQKKRENCRTLSRPAN